MPRANTHTRKVEVRPTPPLRSHSAYNTYGITLRVRSLRAYASDVVAETLRCGLEDAGFEVIRIACGKEER